MLVNADEVVMPARAVKTATYLVEREGAMLFLSALIQLKGLKGFYSLFHFTSCLCMIGQ